MRQTRTGLIDGTQIADLLQFPFPQFGHMVLGHQLRQQTKMPDQRGTQAIARKQHQSQRQDFELLLERTPSTEATGIATGMPLAALDPRQLPHLRQGTIKKGTGITDLFGDLGKSMQPLLERQPDRQQIAREEDTDTAKTRPGIPGPPEQQEHAAHDGKRTEQGLDITHPLDDHEGQTAQHQHGNQQEDEQAVDEIDGPHRLAPDRRRQRHQRHHGNEDRPCPNKEGFQQLARSAGIGYHARHEMKEYGNQKIGEGQQIEDAGGAVRHEQHTPAHQSRHKGRP